MSMADYMGLKLKHMDSTETGGSSYIVHAGHAAEAIAAGKCKVALITLAGRPLGSRNGLGDASTRGERFRMAPQGGQGGGINEVPEAGFENIWGGTTHNTYGMCAMRHMYEYGTTSEQLAWIKVAASHHAQWNEHAMLREVVTVEEVLELADDRRPAAPAGLLRDLRRRRRGDHGRARGRQEPEAAAGEGDRPRRGAEGPAAAAGTSTSPIPARSGPDRRRGKRRASSPRTSSTPRSTTASPSRC